MGDKLRPNPITGLVDLVGSGGGGGGTTPGGSDGQIQYNNAGAFGGAIVSAPLVMSAGTLSIGNASADGSTKGVATFAAADFNSASGVISLDYVNGQKATTSLPGFLSSTDWNTFNS